jgi:hypothetical protein
MLYRAYDPDAIFSAFAAYPQWKLEAQTETMNLIQWFIDHPESEKDKDDEPPVDKKIYGALKAWLKDYFQDKCAYCESLLDVVGWGDVDHFRPKLRVDGNRAHRGYYWLAYSETNLLPSCERCNRGGKRDKFPVKPQNAHVSQPDADLTVEHPLLLNPYDVRLARPEEHWQYEFRLVQDQFIPTGFVRGVSDEAKESIEVYKLNRDWLVRSRRISEEQAVDKVKSVMAHEKLLDEALDDLFAPSRQHATAVRAACFAYLDYYDQLVKKKLAQRAARNRH